MSSKTKSSHRRSKAAIFLILLSALFVFWAAPAASASSSKCSDCHITGAKAVAASDTISIENSTCYKCHEPKYLLDYQNLDLHAIHDGTSNHSSYLERHPMESARDCGKCHAGTSQCTNCHLKNLSHSGGKPDCATCHGPTTDLFKHPEIKLEKHDIFKYSNETACSVCHDINMDYLSLLNKDRVPVSEPHRLCFQCHSNVYNAWVTGAHFANKTATSSRQHYEETDLEESWKKQNTCTLCHDAHDTEKILWTPPAPALTVEKAENSSSAPTAHIAVFLTFSLAVVVAYFINRKIKR